jgi:hypothetical protein
MALPRQLDSVGEFVLPVHVVPFPRGFAFGLDGTRSLASGVGPDGLLYCVAGDTVLAFNLETGQCAGVAVEFPGLYGQALIFYPD